jgi:alginate O-acetyltransferase complex protein AlgJ
VAGALPPPGWQTVRVLRRFCLVLLVLSTTTLAGCGGAASETERTERPRPAAVPSPTLHTASAPAPTVVEGRDGFLFFGADFDLSCGSGQTFDRDLEQLGEVAGIIAASGREVVWTVAPDKSTALVDRLPESTPHDACFRDNQRWQEHLLGEVTEEHYVDSLALLRSADEAGEQVFWRGDSHWTSYGASLWLRELVERLDPTLAERLEVTDGTAERTGDLYVEAGRDDVEQARSAAFATGATVEAVPDGPVFDPGRDEWGPLQWRSRPAEGLHPGRTLVIGDSFSYAAIDLTMPLFARGDFAWFQYFTDEELAAQVAAADTVVLEVSQRTLTHAQVAQEPFADAVEKALSD